MAEMHPIHRTLELWLGRAGTGKTRQCLEEIAGELKARPRGAPLLLIVPEQAAATAELELARMLEPRAGRKTAGFIRARVFSFQQLNREVFNRAGGRPAEVIDEAARVLLIREAIRTRADELDVLKPVADLPELAEAASKTLLEFEHHGWTEADLRARIHAMNAEGAAGAPLALKLEDLARIWKAYGEALAERGLIDSSKRAELDLKTLRDWDGLNGARIWIDGFTTFTVPELRTIEALLEKSERLAVTLGADAATLAEDPLRLIGPERTFESLRRTRDALQEMARQCGCSVRVQEFPKDAGQTRFREWRPMEHLESCVLTKLQPKPFSENGSDAEWRQLQSLAPGWPQGPIELVEAADARGEIEAAARRLAALRARGIAWREMAVLARDLSVYAPLVREIFPREGIPFFLDEVRPVLGHPLARFLINALACIAEDFPSARIVDYLKSGFAPGMPPETASRIENLGRRRRLQGRDWREKQRWLPHPEAHGSEAGREAEAASAERLFAEFAAAMKPLGDFGRALRDSGRSPARAAWEFLELLRAGETLEAWASEAEAAGRVEEALTHREAWRETVELLDRLHKIAANGADANREAAQFRATLQMGFGLAKARLIPPTLDQALVGSVARTRAPGVRAAIILGLVEGEFPKAYDEDAMLGDEDRRLLAAGGTRVGPNSIERFNHERYLAYTALTRASEYLAVSRPLADSGRRATSRSPVLNAIVAAFPWIERAPEISAPASPAERAAEIAAAYHAACDGDPPAALARVLAAPHLLSHPSLEADLAARARAARILRAAAPQESARLSSALARQHFLADPALPVTAFEAYLRCPFKFFAERMLRLERPAEPLPGPLELGQLRHEILHHLFVRLGGGGAVDWGGVDLARAEAMIGEIAPELAGAALAEKFGDDPLTRAIIAAAAREMQFFVRALKAMGARYGFVQAESEHRFGASRQNHLSIAVDDELAFALEGSIDRVDRPRDAAAFPGGFIVFDYKSGGRSLELGKLWEGVELQLPVYSLALARNDPAARPAGFFYWPLAIGQENAEGETWAEPATEEWFRKRRPQGLFDETAAGLLDERAKPGEPAFALNFRLANKGGLDSRSSSHLPPEIFRAILARAQALLGKAADGIASGKIPAEPWRMKKAKACDLCEMASLCAIHAAPEDAFQEVRALNKKAFQTLCAEQPAGGARR